MDMTGTRSVLEEFGPIVEKIEHLDHSIRIAMVVENRHDDPLVQSWLHLLQEIDDRMRHLEESIRGGC